MEQTYNVNLTQEQISAIGYAAQLVLSAYIGAPSDPDMDEEVAENMQSAMNTLYEVAGFGKFNFLKGEE